MWIVDNLPSCFSVAFVVVVVRAEMNWAGRRLEATLNLENLCAVLCGDGYVEKEKISPNNQNTGCLCCALSL